MSKTLVAIFEDYHSAENAARKIKENGLKTDDISIVAKYSEQDNDNDNVRGMNASMIGNMGTGSMGGVSANNGNNREGTNDNISDGIVTGGILGGLAGLLIGAGSMMIPGLGIIAAAGPITGLISGAVTGGVVGGLIDLGIPENKSKEYESDIKQGKVLFSMRTEEDKINQVIDILKENGAKNVESY